MKNETVTQEITEDQTQAKTDEQKGMDAAELREFLQANADNYKFLSQMMFKELNQETIKVLEQAQWPTDSDNAHLDRGYSYLRRYFKFSQGDRETQLACEYARIFLAAGIYGMDKQVACPYESIFTSEDHNVMGASRDSVRRIFREDGFLVNPGLHEPEDHLSFELEYLSTMNERALQLMDEGDTKGLQKNLSRQATFINQHLLNWVPDLLTMAKQFAKLSFYLGMLNICIGSLEQTLATLDLAAQSASDALNQAA